MECSSPTNSGETDYECFNDFLLGQNALTLHIFSEICNFISTRVSLTDEHKKIPSEKKSLRAIP